MPTRRKQDLTEKIVISLCISLLVCMGFHHIDALKAIAVVAAGPGGCAAPPAFVVGLQAQVASDEDLLPKTGGSSRVRNETITRTTTPSTPPTAAPAPPPAPPTPKNEPTPVKPDATAPPSATP